jgi:hypothetical protein
MEAVWRIGRSNTDVETVEFYAHRWTRSRFQVFHKDLQRNSILQLFGENLSVLLEIFDQWRHILLPIHIFVIIASDPENVS